MEVLGHLLPKRLEVLLDFVGAHVVLLGLVNALEELWDALKQLFVVLDDLSQSLGTLCSSDSFFMAQ